MNIDFLDKFSSAKVLVVGDIILDRYWWGNSNRISPEAPVPVVRLTNVTLAAGGAANVAANVSGLGATCYLIGAVGEDAEAEQVATVLTENGVSAADLIALPGRPTIVKSRLMANGQQVARIDQEDDTYLEAGSDLEAKVIAEINKILGLVDTVVVSDYGKGLLSDNILSHIIDTAKSLDKPVLVDPKGKKYGKYRRSTLLTPNRREAAEACNLHEYEAGLVAHAGEHLLRELNVDSVLITQGGDGMTLFKNDGSSTHLSAVARNVFDVTGAGDTVIATLATAVGCGISLEDSANIANIAAGIVVERVGTTPIKIDELRKALSDIKTVQS